jgi:hypothetical protein
VNGQQEGNSLSAGIYVSASGYELVENNVIFDYKQSTAMTGASIKVVGNTPNTQPVDILNNKIILSASHGFFIATGAAYVNFKGNTISRCANADVLISQSSLAAAGGHVLSNNQIFRSTGNNIPAFQLVKAALQVIPVIIKNNEIFGNDNSNSAVENSAFFVTSDTDGFYRIKNNEIKTFYRGYYSANYWTGRNIDAVFSGNTFEDINTAWDISATANNVTVPVVDNKYINVTTLSAGSIGAPAARVCKEYNGRLEWESTASPTVGSWDVGDRSRNTTPAVGQPKAWVCTVAGAPGTWVSEGNL